MARLPEGTIATVTWPIPDQTEFALGMMPPISSDTSVPISWEIDGTRWFMFCPLSALRAIEGEG